MKKQVKLLSAVMAMTMLSGVATLNQTAKAEETEPTNVFTMAKGASVRVPDVTNADVTTNDNGLRFTAYMSKDNYNAEATYGTFIMPLEYYQANPVSAETLAENYYWKTGVDADGNDVYNTTETDGKKQIINVEAIAYLDEVDYNEDKATEEMYVMNGSVRHIKGDNLALEYIGVSYAKVGDTYTFAEQTTDNARSVVEVAQKALLNAANDEAFTANELGTTEQKVTAVDNAYTARYVTKYQEDNDGAYPTVEMNVRAYKDISSTSGYVAEDTIAKIEVPFTGYDATATGMAKTIDGYTYVSLKTEPVTVMFDGSSEEIKHYYDYTANDIVLWDGDEVLADTTFGVTQYWNKVDYATDHKDYRECAKVSNELVYSGNSMAITPDKDAWDGPLWRNPLNIVARKFSFYVNAPADGQVKLEVRGTNLDGTTDWVGGTQVINVVKGVQKVYVDLGEETRLIDGFNFKTRFNGGYTAYYIDNICAEIEYGLEEGYMPTAFGYTKGEHDNYNSVFNVSAISTISFQAPVLKSSVYFPEELEANQLTISYKNNAETPNYTSLSTVDGVYTISIPEDSTATVYTIKAETTDGEYSKEYVVRKGVEYTNFEYDIIGDSDWGVSNNSYGNGGWLTAPWQSASLVVPKWYEYKLNNGAYACKMANGATYITNRSTMNLPFTCKKIGLWLSDASTRGVNESLTYQGKTIDLTNWQVKADGKWILSAKSNVVVDNIGQYVEFELKEGFTSFQAGAFYYVANQVNLDSIVFLA